MLPRPVVRRLRARGVEAVALGWVDNAGVHRVRAVPVGALRRARPGVSRQLDASLPDGTRAETAVPRAPDVRLRADPRRAVPLAAAPGWAWAPADRLTHDGRPYPLCQRTLLRRRVADLAARGLRLRVGTEVEWMAGTRRGDGLVPLTGGPASGAGALLEAAGYLREVLGALRAAGLRVATLHPEDEPGCFEVALGPLPPVAAADAAVLARATIRAVSLRRGVAVSFAPVPADGVTLGAHLHLSLWRGGRNECATGAVAGTLTPAAAAFCAGVLEHLPALLAVATPSATSYLRLSPGALSGRFLAWSGSSRYTALRVVPAGDRPRAANVEVRCLDASANPYLALAGLVTAGLAGVDGGRPLPAEATGDDVAAVETADPGDAAGTRPAGGDAAGTPPAGGDPAGRSGARLRLLPRDLATAVAALEADAVVRRGLGAELAHAVLAARRQEAAAHRTRGEAEALDRARWCW